MLKLKIALLCLMLSGALYTGAQAIGKVNSLRKNPIPEKIYADFTARSEQAEYYLKAFGGYVGIFEDEDFEKLLRLTEVELINLRDGDRAMLEKGIPIMDRKQLLEILEDIAS